LGAKAVKVANLGYDYQRNCHICIDEHGRINWVKDIRFVDYDFSAMKVLGFDSDPQGNNQLTLSTHGGDLRFAQLISNQQQQQTQLPTNSSLSPPQNQLIAATPPATIAPPIATPKLSPSGRPVRNTRPPWYYGVFNYENELVSSTARAIDGDVVSAAA